MVVIAGDWTGTLGELAITYDEGRLIGVLTGTGGITELVEPIITASGKQTGACVPYDEDPERLVDRLLHDDRTEHVRKPSCFCDAQTGGRTMTASGHVGHAPSATTGVGGAAVPVQRIELPVVGLTCGACVQAVEQALLVVPGVSGATVNLSQGRAFVEYDPRGPPWLPCMTRSRRPGTGQRRPRPGSGSTGSPAPPVSRRSRPPSMRRRWCSPPR